MNDPITRQEFRYQDEIVRSIQREVISVSAKTEATNDKLDSLIERVEDLSRKDIFREGRIKGISGAWGLMAGAIALALSLRPIISEFLYAQSNVSSEQIHLVENGGADG